jgi:hypothetical protein
VVGEHGADAWWSVSLGGGTTRKRGRGLLRKKDCQQKAMMTPMMADTKRTPKVLALRKSQSRPLSRMPPR